MHFTYPYNLVWLRGKEIHGDLIPFLVIAPTKHLHAKLVFCHWFLLLAMSLSVVWHAVCICFPITAHQNPWTDLAAEWLDKGFWEVEGLGVDLHNIVEDGISCQNEAEKTGGKAQPQSTPQGAKFVTWWLLWLLLFFFFPVLTFHWVFKIPFFIIPSSPVPPVSLSLSTFPPPVSPLPTPTTPYPHQLINTVQSGRSGIFPHDANNFRRGNA